MSAVEGFAIVMGALASVVTIATFMFGVAERRRNWLSRVAAVLDELLENDRAGRIAQRPDDRRREIRVDAWVEHRHELRARLDPGLIASLESLYRDLRDAQENNDAVPPDAEARIGSVVSRLNATLAPSGFGGLWFGLGARRRQRVLEIHTEPPQSLKALKPRPHSIAVPSAPPRTAPTPARRTETAVRSSGSDCDHLSLFEKARVPLNRMYVVARILLQRLLVPVLRGTAVLLAAYGVGQMARIYSFPSAATWASGSVWNGVLVGLAVAAALGFLLTSRGLVKALRKTRQNWQLEQASRSLFDHIVWETTIPPSGLSVHVWTVGGPVGFRRLELSARITTSGHRHGTPIIWWKDKGVIGRAWSEKRSVFADLDALWTIAGNRDAFYALSLNDRLRLTWREFYKTSQYRAVLAVPLFQTRPVFAPRVIGCLSVDLTVDGKSEELEHLAQSDDLHVTARACEAILCGESVWLRSPSLYSRGPLRPWAVWHPGRNR